MGQRQPPARSLSLGERADPTLWCTSTRRGLTIDEVAARVSYTVETTVLPYSPCIANLRIFP